MTTTQRATCWSLTINNPTPGDDECLNLAMQKGWKVLGQLEKGETDGTPHYQIRLQTPQVRFSAVKKAFPRAHIEVAKNSAALGNYVTKEATRVAPLPVSSEQYPSLSTFWDYVYDYCVDNNYINWATLDMPVLGWWKEAPSNRMSILDEAAGHMITQGYFVESIAANPSTRAMWVRYQNHILTRCHLRKVAKTGQDPVQGDMTDRQTDTASVSGEEICPDENITNDSSVARSEQLGWDSDVGPATQVHLPSCEDCDDDQ